MTFIQKIRSKFSRKAKNISGDFRHALGLYNSFYESAQGSRILVYHGICKHHHLKFNTIFLTEKTFEAHLRFYQKHFNVVSLDDYYQQKFSKDKFNVCLTFDDGFANNHKYVLPLLEKYQVPATFFVTAIRAADYDVLWNDFLSIFSKYGPQKIVLGNEPYTKNRHNKYISIISEISLNENLRDTGFAEKAEMMKQQYPILPFKTKNSDEDYWLQMTPAQIKEMAASPLATIGAHGYYHNDLAKIDITSAAHELSFTKQYLENITGKAVSSFAFPYGSYNPKVLNAAKTAGYSQLLATEFNDNEDFLNLALRERLTVNPFISVNNQMYATVTGSYE